MTKKCMKYNFTISWSSFNFGNKAIIIILFLKKKKKKKKKSFRTQFNSTIIKKMYPKTLLKINN
jgi:hypothetical protein